MAPSASHLLVFRDLGNLKAPESEPFKLEGEALCIGRSTKADIRIYGADSSRFHATLLRQRDEENRTYYYLLHDGDVKSGKPSANGTYVNGRQIAKYRLCHGDRILFGSQIEAVYWYIPVKANTDRESYADTQSIENLSEQFDLGELDP